MEVEQDDPYWSVNMKRGLLNVFEMKMENTPALSAEAPLNPEIAEAYNVNEILLDSAEEKIFIVMEVYS